MRAAGLPVALIAAAGLTTGAVAGTVALASVPAPAPPAKATIRLGVGVAGLRLNQATGEVQADGTLPIAPVKDWGPLVGEFCFEGTVCSWLVPGGGDQDVVTIERTVAPPRRIVSISAAARGWRTTKGVGAGTPLATLRARYHPLTPMTTCDIGGFGAQRTGYRFGRHAFFEIERGKVAIVHLARNAIRPGAC